MDIAALKRDLDGVRIEDNEKIVQQKSRDFYWYSPVLKRQLDAVTGDLVVSPKNEAEVVRVLTERHGLGETEARTAAALAGGSPGLALSMRAGRSSEARAVALAALRAMVEARGPAGRLAAAKVLAGKAEGESGRKKGGDGVSRAVLGDRLEALGALLRDVQVLSSRADDRWVAAADLADDVGRVARLVDGRRAGRAFAAVDRARAALERNASPKVVADWLAVQL